MSARKILSFLLPFIGLAIFVFIIKTVGWDNIAGTFKAADWKRSFLLPVFILFIIVIRGYRWQYLMRMVDIEYPIGRSMVVWTIGFFAAAVTPGKIGDALRAFYVSRDTGRSFVESFITVFIDRLLDLLVVLLFAATAIPLLLFASDRWFNRPIEIPSMWILAVSIAVIFMLVYAMLRRDIMKKILKPIFNLLFPKKYKEQMSVNFNSFYDLLTIYGRMWRSTGYAFILTLIYWCGVFGLACYTAYIMRTQVPLDYLFVIMPLVTLVELLPVSISGIGTRDALIIFFFMQIYPEAARAGAQAQAVGFSIAYLLIGTYMTSVIGFVLWLKHPAKLGK